MGNKSSSSARLTQRDYETRVRTVACPSCDAGPGERCDFGAWAHTTRYRVAVEHGLVPPLPGDQRG